MKSHPLRLFVFAFLLALLGSGAAAEAELSAGGGLFVSFAGNISPSVLPRRQRAPVAVHIAATVRTLSGELPPALRQIKIELNRGGHLDTTHLPTCAIAQIQPTSSAESLAACAPALVGAGTYAAASSLPEQPYFASRGRILAFNALIDGHRAILAHLYGTKPVPMSRTLVFQVDRGHGTYGTVLLGNLPAANGYDYLTHFSLSLKREFSYRGQRRSYLSAACEAPAGFPGASFPFARAAMIFADGRSLSSVLTRSCRVRG